MGKPLIRIEIGNGAAAWILVAALAVVVVLGVLASGRARSHQFEEPEIEPVHIIR